MLYSAISAIHIDLLPSTDSPSTGPGGIFRYFTSWALMMQFVYWMFALAFDSLQWTIWFTTPAPVRAVANTGGWPPHPPVVQKWRLHYDRFFFLMFVVAGGMGGLVHLQWIIGCISSPPCDNLVGTELKLIHAQPFWWALIELILVPHWHDSKRHPPWWVDMGVIFVFLSSWAVHYVTFYKLTDHYIYGNAWTPLRWLLYSAMLPLYIVIRLLTYVRFKLAIRCGKRWPYRFGYMLTIHPAPSAASVSGTSSGTSSTRISGPSTRLSSALSIDYGARGLPPLPTTRPLIASFHDLSNSNSSGVIGSGTPDDGMLIAIHHPTAGVSSHATTTTSAAAGAGAQPVRSSLAAPMDVPMVVSPPRSAPRSPLVAPMTPGSLGSLSPTNSIPSISPLLAPLPPTASAALLQPLSDQSARRTSSSGHSASGTRAAAINGSANGHHSSGRYSSRGNQIGSMDVPVVYHRHSITDFDTHLLPHGTTGGAYETVTHSHSHPASPIDDDHEENDHDGAGGAPHDYHDDPTRYLRAPDGHNNDNDDGYGGMVSPKSGGSSVTNTPSLKKKQLSRWQRFVRWNGSPIIMTSLIALGCIATWDIAWLAGVRP